MRFNARFRPRRRWLPLVVALVAIAAAFIMVFAPPEPEEVDPIAEGSYRVEYVIDGDTLILSGGRRVRLIGVDTPETVKRDHPIEPWGPEASQFTREFVGEHAVRLEFDRERVDRHGRLLAYVWVGSQLLNEELLRAGLARFEPQYHYAEKMKRRFRTAEDSARRAELGIWSRRNKSLPVSRRGQRLNSKSAGIQGPHAVRLSTLLNAKIGC